MCRWVSVAVFRKLTPFQFENLPSDLMELWASLPQDHLPALSGAVPREAAPDWSPYSGSLSNSPSVSVEVVNQPPPAPRQRTFLALQHEVEGVVLFDPCGQYGTMTGKG